MHALHSANYRPGASHFDTRPMDQMISGPFSTGPFGTSLVDIFDNTGAQFTFIGKKAEGGRDVFEYSSVCHRNPAISASRRQGDGR